jgi:hypothetical protein
VAEPEVVAAHAVCSEQAVDIAVRPAGLVAQRDKAATSKALNERTQFLDQMMQNTDPNSSKYKEYQKQRDLVIQQFLQDQAMLGGKAAPAAAIKGTVERIG